VRPLEWIAVSGVAGALLLALAGICSIVYLAAVKRGSSVVGTAVRSAARHTSTSWPPRPASTSSSRSATRPGEPSSRGHPLTELQEHARRDLVPTYRRFGECLQIAGAFADPATARTLIPLHRSVTQWINASEQDLPDADRSQSYAVYLRGSAYVRAIRADLGLRDLDEVKNFAETWTASDVAPESPGAAPPGRQRSSAEAERTSKHIVE